MKIVSFNALEVERFHNGLLFPNEAEHYADSDEGPGDKCPELPWRSLPLCLEFTQGKVERINSLDQSYPSKKHLIQNQHPRKWLLLHALNKDTSTTKCKLEESKKIKLNSVSKFIMHENSLKPGLPILD